MKRDPTKKLDPMTMLALAKARAKQDRRAVSYLIAAAVLVVCLGVIGYFLWPEDPPRYALAAYDAVAAPAERISLSARLEVEAATEKSSRNERELWFQIIATQQAETAAMDEQGLAVISWESPKTGGKPLEFMVRHQPKDDPKQVARDQGRIFVWPATAKLLVVDVDHALIDDVESLSENAAPTLRPGAAAALRSTSGRYKIIYVSAAAATPGRYKKLRAWLRLAATTAQGQLPDGPLITSSGQLGSPIVWLAALRKQFPESAVGIAGREQEAETFRAAGWKAVIIGTDKSNVDGVSTIAGWGELGKQLGP